MKVLSLDPGAERMGWAIVTDAPSCFDSGVIATPRLVKEAYQPYRLRLLGAVGNTIGPILDLYNPDVVVAEILPARGFSNMSQAYLALSAVTTVQALAIDRSITLAQVAANSVKKSIGGYHKATKVGVRNGVLKLLPELGYKKSQWVKVFDESDAIAVGLAWLGFNNAV